MQRLLCLSLLALLGSGFAVRAAEPAVEVRIQPISGLLGHFEYLGNLVGQAEPAKQAAALVQAFTNPTKGLEGVDTTRPIGAYAIVTPGVVDSQVVGLLPIADSDAFLALLREKLRLKPKESEGLYELRIPNVPVPVYFRFQDGYLHITAVSAAGIDPAKLVKPAVFFAQKQSSVLSARIYFDHIPKELKQTVFGQMELRVEEAKGQRQSGETPAQQKLRGLGLDLLLDAVKSIAEEGTEWTFDLVVDPKQDVLRLDTGLSARTGTALAAALTGASTPGQGAALAYRAQHPLAAGYLNVALPKRYRERLSEMVDLIVEEGVQKAEPDAQEVARIALNAIAPTLKSGVLDAGFVLTGPANDRTIGLTTAVRSTETTAIDAAIRKLAELIPSEIIEFKLGNTDGQGTTIHAVTPIEDNSLEQPFGSKVITLCTTKNLFLMGFGKANTTLANAAKPAGTQLPPIGVTLSVTRFVSAFEKQLDSDQLAGLVREIFGEKLQPGADEVRLESITGNPFSVRFTVSGKAIQFMVAVDRAKKARATESKEINP